LPFGQVAPWVLFESLRENSALAGVGYPANFFRRIDPAQPKKLTFSGKSVRRSQKS